MLLCFDHLHAKPRPLMTSPGCCCFDWSVWGVIMYLYIRLQFDDKWFEDCSNKDLVCLATSLQAFVRRSGKMGTLSAGRHLSCQL